MGWVASEDRATPRYMGHWRGAQLIIALLGRAALLGDGAGGKARKDPGRPPPKESFELRTSLNYIRILQRQARYDL